MGKKKDCGVIRSIQTQYFDIIQSFYGDFYESFIKSGNTKQEFIKRYLSDQKPILLLNGENSFSARILEFVKSINDFWDQNLQHLADAVQTCGNLGYFGTEENNQTSQYEITIKQNAVFFDLVVLNDPFYKYDKYDRSIRFYSRNEALFFDAIISVLSVQKYILHANDALAVIMPVSALLNEEEEQNLHCRAVTAMEDIAQTIFGIDYNEDDPYSIFKAMKSLSDQDIASILLENEIFIDFFEARKYEEYALGVDGRRNLVEETKSIFGWTNWDFIRCILNYSTIGHVLIETILIHGIHTEAAFKAGMNPIYNAFEWYPNKYYYKSVPGINSSNEYKYICAIQKNEKLAQLVQMDLEELIRFRDKNEAEKFRNLFNTAMSEIVATPDQFNEIAEMVFVKLKENLNSVKLDRKRAYIKGTGISLFGFCKSVAAFVPILSQFLGFVDVGSSVYDVGKAFAGNNDIIRYLIKNRANIFSSDNGVE